VSEPTSALVRRVMPAPPSVVYDEWLDPAALAEWMCPRPAYATKIECDARVGGTYQLDIDDNGASMIVTGRYLELDRPHRISFTWYCSTWGWATAHSVVTVTLDPYGRDETLMTIEHTHLRPDLFDNHHDGWARIAEQLAATLSRRR
jgi:uncharacterized protein YndB with AHSA1/START domain